MIAYEQPGTALADLVRTIPPFQSLPPDEHWLLAHTGRVEHYRRGVPVFQAGGTATEVFALLSGALKLVYCAESRLPFVVRILAPLSLFGLDTITRDEHYSATAEVLCSASAIAWRGPTIVRMMHDHPQFARDLLGIFTARLNDFRTRYVELATESVGTRLARALLRLHDAWLASQEGGAQSGRVGRPWQASDAPLDFPVSREELAHLVGTTIYTVSRTLQRWERSGIVRCGRMRVTLLDPVALRAECGTGNHMDGAGQRPNVM